MYIIEMLESLGICRNDHTEWDIVHKEVANQNLDSNLAHDEEDIVYFN